MTNAIDIQIPGKAVSDGVDLGAPTRALLEEVNLLGSASDEAASTGFASTFAGPPQSVALIEAGATAASKWWAAGLGTSVLALWGSLVAWWGDQESSVKVVALGGAALVTAALVLSIAYLLASDVRGRSLAAVATIHARSTVAQAMIQAAESSNDPQSAESDITLVPLPVAIQVRNSTEPSSNESGWLAVALESHADGTIKYLVVKNSTQATLPVGSLDFGP